MKFSRIGALGLLIGVCLFPAGLDACQATCMNSDSPFGFCYHLVYSKADEATLRKQLSTVASSGAKWVRCDISWPWQRFDSKTGKYSFKNVDRAVRLMKEEGILFLPIINMARPDGLPLHEHLDEWCEFIRQAVSRYKGSVKYWEIWNEQNFKNPKIWGGKDLETHAGNYTACLKAAYRAVKSADPSAVVLYGGTSHVPLDFIEATLRHGAGEGFDVMNVHPYNTSGCPERVGKNLKQLKLLLARYGLGNRPVWITEIGWSTSPRKSTDYYMQVLPRAFSALGIDPSSTTIAVRRAASNPVVDLVGKLPRFKSVVWIDGDEIATLDPKKCPVLLPVSGEVFSAHLQESLVGYARRGGVVILPKGFPLCTIREERDSSGKLKKGPEKYDIRRELKINCRCTWQRAGKTATNVAFSVNGPATSEYGIVCNRYLFPFSDAGDDSFIPLAWGVEGGERKPIAAVYKYSAGGGVIVLTDVGNAVQPCVTPAMQADFVVRAHLTAFAAGARRLFWYSFISNGANRENSNLEANYGLTYSLPDGGVEEKPAFKAYRFLASLIPPCEPRVCIDKRDDGTHVAEWTREDGARVIAFWNPDVSAEFRPVSKPSSAYDIFGHEVPVRDLFTAGSSPFYLIFPQKGK